MILSFPFIIAFFSWARGRAYGAIWIPLGALGIWLACHALGLTDWWQCVKIAVCWAIYRNTPPKLFGESMTPRGLQQLGTCALRHCVAFLFIWALPSWWTALGIWLFVSAAVGLACVRTYYRYEKNTDVGAYVEALQGLALGLALLWPLWRAISVSSSAG